MTSSQEVPSPIIKNELASSSEIERGRLGVSEFKTALKKAPLVSRPGLIYGAEASFVHSLFLGLKAMTHLDKAGFPLPEGMRSGHRHLVDIRTAEKVLKDNPEIYPEYDQNQETAEQYIMDRLLPWSERYIGPDVDLRVGLLYGDPKPAVLDYVNFNRVRTDILKRARLYYKAGAFDIGKDREVLRHLGWLRSDGKSAEDEAGTQDRYQFVKANMGMVGDFLKTHFGVSDEEREYVLGSFEPIKARGFAYSAGRPNQETLNHQKKVEEVYELSGMNAFLKSARLYGMFMR